MSHQTKNRVAIVGGARTPFVKAGSALKDVTELDLATHSVNGALWNRRTVHRADDGRAYGNHGERMANLPA